MSKRAKQNVLLSVAGAIFLFAGLRDLLRPGWLTLNNRVVSKTEIALAMALGLFFLGVAGFRTINSKEPDAQ